MTTEKNIKLISNIILALSLLLIGLKYLAVWLEGFTGVFLLLAAVLTGLILLGLLGIQLVTILRTKKFMLFFPFIVGIIAILVFVYSPIEMLIEKLKSPIVLSGYCEHTVTNVRIDLREDKSFEYNAGAFLANEIYYGNYQINNDTIMLTFGDNKPVNLRNKLIFTDNELLEIGDTAKHRHHFKITCNTLRNN